MSIFLLNSDYIYSIGHSGVSVAEAMGAHRRDTERLLRIQIEQETRQHAQSKWDKAVDIARPPVFVVVMVVAMALMHAVLDAEARLRMEWTPGEWWRQPWRVFTYSLIHTTRRHLMLNCIMALAVGWLLEREQCWWRVCAVWAAGVACGALGAGLLQPEVRVAGASAAVFALLASHIPHTLYRWKELRCPWAWCRLLSVPVLCAGDLLHTVTTPSESVAWSSHWVGAASGLLVGFLIYECSAQNAAAVMALARIASVTVASVCVLGLIFYYCYVYAERVKQSRQT